MVRAGRRGHSGATSPTCLPARPTGTGDGLPGMAAAGRAGQALVLNLAERRLKQTTAQATSTNANHRSESRSQRTPSRRQQLNHDSDRSTFHRCRPSRVEDSTPRRAIRGRIPRRRRYARFAALSYALSAWTLPGRVRRRPDGARIGGTSSRTAWNMVVSATWRRSPHGQRQPTTVADQLQLAPRLATIDGMCAHLVPPRLARTLMVSTLTRDQSSRPCSPSRSSTSRWSWSNTPALAHSVRRRQQVAGEPLPSSRAGSSRHGVEVRAAMNTIAAKQLRSEMVRPARAAAADLVGVDRRAPGRPDLRRRPRPGADPQILEVLAASSSDCRARLL
jgi:hypothetical protein